jgi:hypothetical protein
MRDRIRTAVVLGHRQLREALLGAGWWVSLTAALAVAHFAVALFVGSLDSSGFNPERTPVAGLLARALTGAFGAALVGDLFAEGPFLLALFAAALPALGWIAISSVLRFGLEKSAGAVELLVYGPVDGTAYCLASFLRDAVLATTALAVILAFLGIEALTGGLVLGPRFFTALAAVWVAAFSVSAWGILCSVVAGGASSGLAMFAGLMAVFLVVLAGSFAISSAQVKAASTAVAWVVRWVSPWHYLALALRSRGAAIAGSVALQGVLSAALLGASHLVIGRRGVRA